MPSLPRYFCVLAGVVLVPAALFAAPQKPPANVILVTIDTLRADHLGCYGYHHIETPNIDAVARDRVRFERVLAAVPVTLASHPSSHTRPYTMYGWVPSIIASQLCSNA